LPHDVAWGRGEVTDRATQLFEAGFYADALVLFQESADRYRAEAARYPARFEVALASDLNNVGLCLSHLRRYDEAVGVLQEAARICEWYWQDDKRLSAFYAAVLASLATALGELGHYQQAMEITNHVVLLRRASRLPGSPEIDPELARALRQFAEVRARAGVELDAALAAVTEAVTLYEQLVRVSPQTFVGGLCAGYGILADVLAGLGRHGDAARVRAGLAP
jgi:tetratricopeptide (TPR) repeat protein